MKLPRMSQKKRMRIYKIRLTFSKTSSKKTLGLEKENEELSIKSKWLNKALEIFSMWQQSFQVNSSLPKGSYNEKRLKDKSTMSEKYYLNAKA